MIKKFTITLFSTVLLVGMFVPSLSPVNAKLNLGEDLTKNAARQAGYDASADETSFAAGIGSIIKAALSFVGVIFLVLMIYAGFLWMTARGKEDQVEKAQEIIRAAIIGLIITVGSYSITAFVVPKIVEKAGGGTNASVPQAAPQAPPAR